MKRRTLISMSWLALLAPFAARAAVASPAAAPPRKTFKLRAEDIQALVPAMGGAFATDRITVDGAPIGYMYREKADRPEDSGWRFFAGDEDQAYIDDLDNTSVFDVNTIANYDPDIIPYLDTPAPCAFEKVPGTQSYRAIEA